MPHGPALVYTRPNAGPSFRRRVFAWGDRLVDSVVTRAPADDAIRMIDGIPVQAALIDGDGRIVAINEHWKRFARDNAFPGADLGLGCNYVDICRSAEGAFSAEGPVVAAGLNDLLGGRVEEFSLVYPCHSPVEQRWFRMLASRTRDVSGAVILHFNITPERLAEERAIAGRVAAEKILQALKDNLRQISKRELAVVDAAADSADVEVTRYRALLQEYRLVLEECIAERSRGAALGFRARARRMARELAASGADASFVSRLHIDALRAASSPTREGAAFVAHEARMVFIAVLGHLANAYREEREGGDR